MNPEKAKQVLRAIKSLAKGDDRYSINEIRIIVALERAIARLAQNNELAEHLIFKGGFVLLKNYDSERFTRDVDALAVAIPKEKLKELVSKALIGEFDDGFWFGNVKVRDLSNQGEYGAYRFDCAFQIGEPDLRKLKKFSRIHIDVNFSDRLPTKPPNQQLQSLLGNEEDIIWKIYPIEYIIAEKVQIIFDRGSANSRAKDLYDLNYLFALSTERGELIEAIRKTFRNRNTQLPSSFAEAAKGIDRTILKGAWPGIEVPGEKAGFDEAWDLLIKHLTDLDEQFRK